VANTLSLLLLLIALTGSALSQAPQIGCRIDQISPENRSLRIDCLVTALSARKITLRFKDEFAGIDRLSERIDSLKGADARGAELKPEIRGDGLYGFDVAAPVRISYQMRLARAYNSAQHALVSSLGPEAAVLMMADLLPEFCAEESRCNFPTRVKISPPEGWKIATTETRREEFYDLEDLSRAIFLVSRFRERAVKIGEMNLRSAIAGTWNFNDDDVFKLVEAIAREQAELIQSREAGDFLVTLAPYPQPITGLGSSAVTIGHTVVLMLNQSNDAARTLAHYGRHLAHEMFHFYLPNAFQIRENFDWFWEGFTRYIALITLTRLHLVAFQEYLDLIAAEYESYGLNPLKTEVSLLDASPKKFSGAANYNLVYRKGMLVAALYDLELRWRSKGKSSLSVVMRSLYSNYARGNQPIGNREVIDELRRQGDFTRLVRDDIEGVQEIELAKRIKAYGLGIEQSAATRTLRITIPAKSSDRLRDLIAQLTNGGS